MFIFPAAYGEFAETFRFLLLVGMIFRELFMLLMIGARVLLELQMLATWEHNAKKKQEIDFVFISLAVHFISSLGK